jgi:hypothetical protein
MRCPRRGPPFNPTALLLLRAACTAPSLLSLQETVDGVPASARPHGMPHSFLSSHHKDTAACDARRPVMILHRRTAGQVARAEPCGQSTPSTSSRCQLYPSTSASTECATHYIVSFCAAHGMRSGGAEHQLPLAPCALNRAHGWAVSSCRAARRARRACQEGCGGVERRQGRAQVQVSKQPGMRQAACRARKGKGRRVEGTSRR